MRFLALLLAVLTAIIAAPASAEFRSYAVVQYDASLIIQGRRVYLYGIHIPQQGQLCDKNLRPTFCGNRAAVALDFKIQGFVTCREMGTYDDGSVSAVCWTGASNFKRGEDLGAYLISNGLAVAGPDAPYEYRTLERIAEANGLGVWGFQADTFTFRRFR